MPNHRAKLARALVVGVLVLIVVGILVAAMPLVRLNSSRWWQRPAEENSPNREQAPAAELVPDQPDTLRLPPDVVEVFHIQTAPVQATTPARQLRLSGTLALDTNQLARVHARFAGEVVHIEEVPDQRSPGTTRLRSLRPGDKVERGQLLAIVWSKDLGEKKSELVDALAKLRLDRDTLERLQAAYQKGAIPERNLREAEHAVEADEIAVARAERTLRAWRLTDAEIEAVRAEAARLRQRPPPQPEPEKDWAKVEVRASLDGTLVEKNVTVGDIVDTTTDLFKLADLSQLSVWAYAYEEDLPALLALTPEQMHWTVRLQSDPDAPPLEGTIDFISSILDPNQHTALIKGQVDNAAGRLRAGQFITATITLPPPPHEVLIPAAALVEDGRAHVVFVQPDPAQPAYTLRRVAVSRRFLDGVAIRSQLRPEDERQGLKPLLPGERVVSRGAVELKAALEDLKATAKPSPEPLAVRPP